MSYLHETQHLTVPRFRKVNKEAPLWKSPPQKPFPKGGPGGSRSFNKTRNFLHGNGVMVAWNYPKSVDEAVNKLIEELPLKDRVYIAGLEKKDLGLIHGLLGSYIRQDFGLFRGNMELIESCRKVSGIRGLTADQVPLVIMKALWQRLKATHALRVVKKEKDST